MVGNQSIGHSRSDGNGWVSCVAVWDSNGRIFHVRAGLSTAGLLTIWPLTFRRQYKFATPLKIVTSPPLCSNTVKVMHNIKGLNMKSHFFFLQLNDDILSKWKINYYRNSSICTNRGHYFIDSMPFFLCLVSELILKDFEFNSVTETSPLSIWIPNVIHQ